MKIIRSIIWSLISLITLISHHAILIQASLHPASGSDSDTESYSADRGHTLIQGDELILTGSDGGCWEDDECQAYPPAENGSGSDDLITPRIVVLNPRPSLAPVHGMRTSSSTIRSTCIDDEDCNDNDMYEGSGYGSPGQSGRDSRPGQPRRVYPYDTDAMTPTYVRPQPPPSTAWEDDKSILYTSKPIPPSDNVTPWPVIPKPRPTAPRPTGPRVIVDVPKPVIPSKGTSTGNGGSISSGGSGKKDSDAGRGTSGKSGRTPSMVPSNPNTSVYNKSAADRTALVIGLVAAILIIIVIVAPLIVFCKVRLRGAVGKGGQLLTTSSDRTQLYQPFVQPTVTATGMVPMTPGVHPPTTQQQPRFPASVSLGHGLLSTGIYGQTGVAYGTIGGQQVGYGTIGQSGPGTLPKKKDNREWYV